MSVEHSNDEYALRLDQVDEAVTPVGEPSQRLGSVHGKLGQIGGIGLGVLGDELDGRFQVLDGGGSPDYLASHLERRFFTCSWL